MRVSVSRCIDTKMNLSQVPWTMRILPWFSYSMYHITNTSHILLRVWLAIWLHFSMILSIFTHTDLFIITFMHVSVNSQHKLCKVLNFWWRVYHDCVEKQPPRKSQFKSILNIVWNKNIDLIMAIILMVS